jgi:hypothetical protein
VPQEACGFPRWYQAALKQKEGRIIAAGMTKEVTFEAVDGKMKDP